MPKDNGKLRSGKTPPAKYLFASDEEIANRNGTGYDRRPSAHAPSFKQIGPQMTGKDANDPTTDTASGNLKFGSLD